MKEDLIPRIDLEITEARLALEKKLAELREVLWEDEMFAPQSVADTLVLALTNKEEAISQTVPHLITARKKVPALIYKINRLAVKYWTAQLGGPW